MWRMPFLAVPVMLAAVFLERAAGLVQLAVLAALLALLVTLAVVFSGRGAVLVRLTRSS